MVPVALGTDTLGSLRIPSALCGTSSIKPTHGRVPMDGILPLAASLDHAGPIARTIAECGAVLTADRPGRQELDPDEGEGLEAARAACEELGARVVEHPAPAELAGAHMSVILLAEMWVLHRGYADCAERYRPSIRELVDAGSRSIEAARYVSAQEARAAFTAEWEHWLDGHGVDLVLEPTAPVVAQARGEGYDPGHAGGEGDPLIAFTSTWDLTGFPVAALPAGLGRRCGLPVGVSLVARTGAEEPLVQAAIDLQEHALPAPAC
jgi:aspartyl-tRNA(Asn)/glutamyl-tRNA(Gln) amidotransferase subunit A